MNILFMYLFVGAILSIFIYHGVGVTHSNAFQSAITSQLRKTAGQWARWVLFNPTQNTWAIRPAMVFSVSALGFALTTMFTMLTPFLESINTMALQATLPDELVYFFVIVTLFADGENLYLIAAFALIYFIYTKNYSGAGHVVLVALMCEILTKALKYYFLVKRPELSFFDTPAYPSGHTSGAATAVAFLGVFFAQAKHSKQKAIYIAIFWLIFISGLSRVYLNVHWLSDIIGGAFLGLMIAGLGHISYHKFAGRRTIHKKPFVVLSATIVTSYTIYVVANWDKTITLYQTAFVA